MTASAIDHDIDGNGKLDLDYEDLNTDGLVDERDRAIAIAAHRNRQNTGFQYQTTDQAKFAEDLKKLAADIKSGRIVAAFDASGDVTLTIDTTKPSAFGLPVTTPPAADQYKPRVQDVTAQNRQETEDLRDGLNSFNERNSADREYNAALDEQLRLARERQRIIDNKGQDFVDRHFDGEWAEGDIGDLGKETLRGTFNLAERAWDVTKGTTRFLTTNPNATAFTTVIGGIGGALLLPSLAGPKIDEYMKGMLGNTLGGFVGSAVKLGLFVLGGIGGLFVGNKGIPALGQAIFNTDDATQPRAPAVDPAAAGTNAPGTTAPVTNPAAPAATTPPVTAPVTPAPGTTAPVAPVAPEAPKFQVPPLGVPMDETAPVAMLSTTGTPKMVLVGGSDPEATAAANEMLAFYRDDAASNAIGQVSSTNRLAFIAEDILGGGVGTGGRHTASDVVAALKLETFDRHGNAITLTGPEPTTPGYELRMSA